MSTDPNLEITFLATHCDRDVFDMQIPAAMKRSNAGWICVYPSWLEYCVKKFADQDIKICVVIGEGGLTTEMKAAAAKWCTDHGASAIAMVPDPDHEKFIDDINTVGEAIPEEEVNLRVIFDAQHLSIISIMHMSAWILPSYANVIRLQGIPGHVLNMINPFVQDHIKDMIIAANHAKGSATITQVVTPYRLFNHIDHLHVLGADQVSLDLS